MSCQPTVYTSLDAAQHCSVDCDDEGWTRRQMDDKDEKRVSFKLTTTIK